MNKGTKKGPGTRTLGPRPHPPPLRSRKAGPYLAPKGCYLGLITPQVAGMVASWGSEGSSSLLPAAWKS